MKKSLFAAAVVALALVSCNKKEEVKVETTTVDTVQAEVKVDSTIVVPNDSVVTETTTTTTEVEKVPGTNQVEVTKTTETEVKTK